MIFFKPKKKQPAPKKLAFKDFTISNYKHTPINKYKLENEDYDLGVKGIVDNCLEDIEIYRFTYDHLRPELRKVGDHYEVYIREEKAGDLDPAQSAGFDSFVSGLDSYELKFSLEGGPFKYYDSSDEKIKTGRHDYSAFVCVKYYENP